MPCESRLSDPSPCTGPRRSGTKTSWSYCHCCSGGCAYTALSQTRWWTAARCIAYECQFATCRWQQAPCLALRDQPFCGGHVPTSRLQPFPPPRATAAQDVGQQYVCGSPVLATSCVAAGEAHSRAVSPCFSGSPPLHRPKTPKTRTAIKEGAKTAGLIRVRTSSETRATKVDELRMAASAHLGVTFGQQTSGQGQATATPAGITGVLADDPGDDGGGLSAHSELTSLE